ncbi:PAS domain-containing sensor histidine kinase [Desulfomonile tiedjei]|uniref:histidine kinase n=1 Tax=Desulfomonile tiedjei (strain ATCC 49306 / DSM 6799 / DCB-1) TaxID=706587 RepID=I4C8F4_DESTA|nr:PAS domain S-box protein [Desulfomonile tiedjei]AFM25845.1 PAS domain S-box [Desulfomonile tiedjei DSM 6799]
MTDSDIRKKAEKRVASKNQDVTIRPFSERRLEELIHDLQTHQIELEMQNEELRRAQLELIEIQENYDLLYNSAPVGYFTLDTKGMIIQVNTTASKMLGKMHLEKIPFFIFVIPEDRGKFRDYFSQLLKTGLKEACDMRLKGMGGELSVWLDGIAIKDSKGKIARVQLIVSNRTAIKLAEKSARSFQIKYRALYEDSADGILLFDNAGIILDCNKASLDLFGYPLEEIRGRRLADLVHPEDRKQVSQELLGLLRGHLSRLNCRMRKRDGTYRAVEVTGRHIEENLNQTLYRDITERLLADERLRKNEELYRQMFHGSQAAKLLIDPESSDIIDANEAAVKFYGYELDRLKKMKISDINELSPSEITAEMEKARSETQNFFRFKHRLASGEIRDVEVYSSTLEVRGRSLLASIIHDVTDRLRAETNLMRSNQDLEQFAYVTSHDLQEPLRTITTALQMFERKHKGQFDQISDELIQFAVDAARKMKALIQDLLAYSRLNTRGHPFERVDLKEVVNRSTDNLRSLIEEKGTLVTVDEMPTVWGDPSQLVQLFQNLIGNAVKFGPEVSPEVHVSVESNGNEWVFSIRDNGVGIQEAHFDRIFVIFQQLDKKNPFEGTGIGLAIVKKIVERHHGRIWVESEIGIGSTFIFTLPTGTES